ncbi:MAG: hypothetical protein QMB37_01465 [Paludibacteraceae bacterium]
MARVKNLDQITGSLKNLSFYTRKGSDAIFVRTKGGPSKEKIKRNPEFEGLRRVNREFGGCSAMSKQIRQSFGELSHVADYNLSSALNSLMKSIQKTDEQHETGSRSIRLSAFRYTLAGFDFGRKTRFSSLLRVPLNFTIDREQQTATVLIPAFACSFGLNMNTEFMKGAVNSGTFRFTAALGIVTDMQLNISGTAYEPVHDKLGHGVLIRSTPWFSTQGSVQEQQIKLALIREYNAAADPHIAPPFVPEFTDADSLVLTIAVEFGTPDAFGNTVPIRGTGGGMVLGVF